MNNKRRIWVIEFLANGKWHLGYGASAFPTKRTADSEVYLARQNSEETVKYRVVRYEATN